MIIGIIAHSDMTEEGNKTKIIYSDIIKAVINNGGIPIGIFLNSNYKESIDLCNGVIFQGGDNFENYELEVLRYAYEIDKPVLGICLGMQLMGELFGGKLINVSNHKKLLSYCHTVKLNKTSKLFSIFKSNLLKVNSRHNSTVKNTKLKISAISMDGYIEAVEDSTKKFFIGVQWHPESMLSYSGIQNELFKSFINHCKK